MKFNDLNEALGEVLAEKQKTEYSKKEQQIIHLLKPGKNILCYTQHDHELLFAEMVVSFSKASTMLEGSPRVLWFSSNTDAVREIKKQFADYFRRTEVTLELADDKGKIIEQRNAIFEGSEWLVGNPKRLLELYNQNGFHVNQLKLVIIDQFDTICKDAMALQAIRRIAESLPKCQYAFFASGKHARIEPFCQEICNFYETVHLD